MAALTHHRPERGGVAKLCHAADFFGNDVQMV